MKTHRQELIEKLDNEFGRTVNATQATIEHLLLLCDMLDERADQFRGAAEKIETPTNEAQAFPDELVERCRNAQQTSIRDALSSRGECHPDVGLLAVLAELAKVDIAELPKGVILPVGDATGAAHVVLNIVRPILAAKDAELSELRAFKAAHEQFFAQSDVTHRILDDAGVPNREPTMRNEMRVLKMQDRVARIIQEKQDALADAWFAVQNELAVRDARIAELEAKLVSTENSAEWHRQQCVTASIELGFAGSTIEEAARKKNTAHDEDKTRIVELEAHAATITAQANQYRADRDHVEETCRMHSERVIALEKELSTTNDIYTDEREERGTYQARCAELEKRIAELTAPVVVDGKTPGQVWDEAFSACVRRAGLVRYAEWDSTSDETRAMGEEAAQAVLRAFGNGAEALKQIRKQIGNAPGEAAEYYQGIIDAEIAKLGVKTDRELFEAMAEEQANG